MKFKRAVPALVLAIPFQFSLPAFLSGLRYVFQQMKIASSFALLAFALIDRIYILPNKATSFFCVLTRCLQGNDRIGAEAPLTLASVKGENENPLASAL